MTAKTPKRPDNNSRALERWENEGGAPASGDRAVRKRPRDPAQLAKFIVDVATGQVEDREPTPEEQGKDPSAAALGRKGGAARAKSMSPERRKEIARQAARKRWQD
jgi:hypothetical protein